MKSRGTKFVRFEGYKSDRSQSSDNQYSPRRVSVREVLGQVGRGVQRGCERIRSLGRIPTSQPAVVKKQEKDKEPRKNILDPQGSFLQKWNKIFVLACLVAVSLDPLFFYIGGIDPKEKCITLDEPLEIVACVLRTFIDIFYVLRIIFQFQTGFIPPSSRVFGRGELVDDPFAIAKRYLSTNFAVDVLSILPLPQLVVLAIIPRMKKPVPMITKEMLKIVVFCQYVPRLVRMVPLFREVTSSSGILTETASAGAIFNLLLYMLASHLVGAFWYLYSLERLDTCWRKVFKEQKWDLRYVYCNQNRTNHVLPDAKSIEGFFNVSCPFINPDDVNGTFNFGIFTDALKSGVIESTDFSSKFFYCFWWGLRNLSSLGQNLKTSTNVGEIIFAVWIAIFGLILFSLLIGNMQKYLQSTTVRVEEMRVKRQDAEQWMSHRMLPEPLRERIRRYEQYKWQETRGVEEETLVRTLPKDLRRDIKRHLCLALLRRVPMFETLDEQLLDALCDRLKPVLYTDKSSIVREGDPVDEMLFIMRGNLATMTTNGGKTGFFNTADLKAGDFCGEELLTWALDPNSGSNLPTSTRTVEAKTEVEAFALMANDLKFVASQFRRLHSKQLQHIFRFYSLQWRTWAACFVQAAWRRHCKRKLDKSLREAEDMLQDVLVNESGSTPSLGATIYASRFAANALRGLRQSGVRSSRPTQRLMPLLPQKPAEPDFTAEHR
ncbi:cyclic nucleotide-gated ion channel 1-like [Humulus lupulus]|uniref:cyclic nucleotide-gated ion channel 1-like n=1 Tax=Humulus lupulus TaxID=3486 RepID=UPI002B4066D8|nr:cyclic nucleotide-gated ion channel 1-like [Humulus lupulus]